MLFQKSKSQIKLNDIQNLKLSELRVLESNEKNIVFNKIKNLKENSHVIVDVENYSQLKKFSLSIKKLPPGNSKPKKASKGKSFEFSDKYFHLSLIY